MSQMPGTSGDGPKDFRPEFTQFMNSQESWDSSCKVTHVTVANMNRQMTREGIPMSEAHFNAAKTSISRGDSLCGFMRAEHNHVMASNGDGPVYNAGKSFHKNVIGPLSRISGDK